MNSNFDSRADQLEAHIAMAQGLATLSSPEKRKEVLEAMFLELSADPDANPRDVVALDFRLSQIEAQQEQELDLTGPDFGIELE